MTSTSVRAALLTLPDVASLARVQRPVVSMWRTRSAGTELPFPPAVVRSGNQELFDAEAVTAWLLTTGRGNNPRVRQESALFSTTQGEGIGGGRVRDGVTALLALKSLTGARLTEMSAAELLDLADDVDLRDDLLYRELAVLGEDLTTLAAHVDAMTDAAFTPSAAFETIMAHRFRIGLDGYTETALAPVAVDLVARLAAELGDDPAVTFVDPSGGSDLLVALRRRRAEDTDLVAVTHRTGRLERRRLAAHGWRVAEAAADDDGHLVLDGPSLVLAQYPSPAAPGITDAQVLAAVDDVALAMGERDRAVVIAPASALADATKVTEVEQARSALLRTDRVRAVVRLPAGLWTTRPRQRLALWVLGPAHPDVAIADRWVAVADLIARPDAAAVEDLVTDVVAALGSRAEVHAHAFRFARLARTSALLAAAGDLVGNAPPRLRLPRNTAAELVLRVRTLLDEAAESPRGELDLGADVHDPGPVPSPARTVTLGELVTAGAVRVVAGNRIDDGDVGAGGAVRVIGTQEILGTPRVGTRTLDRLFFTARYPAGRYTEPGDVVFCTTPGVGAVVDEAGFAAVQAPARVLRLDRRAEPRLVPAVVAHAITAATGPHWRSWPVPLVPAEEADEMDTALAAVARARADAERRITALDELVGALVEGTTTGALTLHRTTDSPHQDTEG